MWVLGTVWTAHSPALHTHLPPSASLAPKPPVPALCQASLSMRPVPSSPSSAHSASAASPPCAPRESSRRTARARSTPPPPASRAAKAAATSRLSRPASPGRKSPSSLQSCKKRSTRADEWSGPWPSKPWGSRRTRPDCCPHRSSAAATNRSIAAWALLAKSPNWASHTTRALPAAPKEYPYSYDKHAASLRGVFHTWTRSWAPGRMASSSTRRRPVPRSRSTAQRWLNVPRSESWPVRRTE